MVHSARVGLKDISHAKEHSSIGVYVDEDAPFSVTEQLDPICEFSIKHFILSKTELVFVVSFERVGLKSSPYTCYLRR